MRDRILENMRRKGVADFAKNMHEKGFYKTINMFGMDYMPSLYNNIVQRWFLNLQFNSRVRSAGLNFLARGTTLDVGIWRF